MAKKLNTYVHVLDDAGERHVFGPGDTVPAWARKKITNPHVWDDGEGGSGGGSSAQKDTGQETGQGPAEGPPPMSGTGSGKESWAAYAAAHNIDVPDDAKRDDIVAALEAAKVPTTREGGD